MFLKLKIFLASLLLRGTQYHVHKNPVHEIKKVIPFDVNPETGIQ